MGKKKYLTEKGVFDEFTERNVFKLISEGHFERLESPLFVGKESNVFTAVKGRGRVIVKIYRLSTCDFNRMYDYIRYDPRFAALKHHRRRIIFAWAQREYRNLLKAREAGVSVPTPIAFLSNILVEECVGRNAIAQKVKDDFPENRTLFFKKVLLNMRRLHRAGFIHADLSEFNILNHNQEPVFIDLSQATPLRNPLARELLGKDIRNMARFFTKIGVRTSEERIRRAVVGA